MRLRNQEKGVNLRKQLEEIPGIKIGDKFRYSNKVYFTN